MLISVVIPAFNEAETLQHTLEQIHKAFDANQQPAFSWEIIVCDNHSTDTTAEIAKKAGAMVVPESDRQIAKARNTGASIATGDWLLFIDADTYPTEDLLKDVLALIRSSDYVGCGTTVEVVDGTMFNKLRMERLNPLFRVFKLTGGAFLLCRRHAFEAINGFSTALYAYEEIDFVIRLKKHGRKKNQRFAVLHQHPVITSGRKGEYTVKSLFRLFASNLAAVLLFVLHYILPANLVRRLGAKWLGYWYSSRT